MKVVSKREAMSIKNANHGAVVSKYDSGKYKWHGSQDHYIGKEVEVREGIAALYVERRQDPDGPYALLMCVVVR